MKRLDVFSLPLFGPLPLLCFSVAVSCLGQCPFHRLPAAAGAIRPAQIPRQLHRLVIADPVYEHAQTVLRRIVAHTDADQDGQQDDGYE